MKHWIVSLAAPLALASQPLAAQEATDAEQEEVLAALVQAFDITPLTSEQEARLPQATALIERIVPDGTMETVMGSMFTDMLGPFMTLAESAGPEIADFVSYDESDFVLEEAEVAEIAAIIDPRWQERQRRTLALTQVMMGQLMAEMEPAMKRGMAEAYAVHFTDAELDDISAFFATRTGATYARKSFELSSDPRIMAAVMAEMPTMFAAFADIEERMQAALADLTPPKDFDALDTAERARIMALTGLDEAGLRAGMTAAAQKRAEDTLF